MFAAKNIQFIGHVVGNTHYYNSWFFKQSKLINWSFLTSEHVHFD
jgi:hypothetical protein